MNSIKILFVLLLFSLLLLASCQDSPGTPDQPETVSTQSITPTKEFIERSPTPTEGEDLTATLTLQPSDTPTLTPTFTNTPFVTTVPTTPTFQPLPALSPGQQVTISYIDMIDPSDGWAIGGVQETSDRLMRTSDGGLTWKEVTPPYQYVSDNVTENLKGAFFLDDSYAWVAVYYLPESDLTDQGQLFGNVWRTQDSGMNWEVSEPFDLIISLYENSDSSVVDPSPPPFMQFLDEDHGWILIRDTGSGMHRHAASMNRTRDGGMRWENLFDPSSDQLQGGIKTGMTFANENIGWSTTGDYPVYEPFVRHTSDGGKNWEEIWLPPPEDDPDLFDYAYCVDQHSPHLFSPSFGMLVVECMILEETDQSTDFLYITQDGGQNWSTRVYPGGALQMLNQQTGWALSRDIYLTNDGGQTWEKIKTVNWDGQFDFVNESTGFAVASSEDRLALVRTSDAGRSWEILEPVLEP
jgi:photosystem II stability/assembly factor-like uncharacterized protein